MNHRNTIQKELVLEAVRAMRSHVTADDVYEYIRKDHPNIGKGTVYRNLNILYKEKEILKVQIPNGPDRFDFTLKEHYHVRCVKCQDVMDVDMDAISDMQDRIKDKHGIKFLNYDILFEGICPACQKMSG